MSTLQRTIPANAPVEPGGGFTSQELNLAQGCPHRPPAAAHRAWRVQIANQGTTAWFARVAMFHSHCLRRRKPFKRRLIDRVGDVEADEEFNER